MGMPRLLPMVLLAAALALAGCCHRAPAPGYGEEGVAGWYGPGFDGRRTASGAIFHAEGLTCAHRTLPFGAVVEVERSDRPGRAGADELARIASALLGGLLESALFPAD